MSAALGPIISSKSDLKPKIFNDGPISDD